MRILLVHNIAPWDPRAGGGQRIHHEIALSLSSLGHDVRALFLGKSDPPPAPVPYPFWWVPEHVRLMNNLRSMAQATQDLLSTWVPDAAYLSSPESAGVYRELPTRTGVLMTSHHPELPHLLGLTSWRRPLKALREVRRLQRFYFERLVLRSAHRRTATSSYGRQILYDRSYLEAGAQVTVVPNGVHRFWFENDRGTDRRANFLFVGRMDDQKGVDLLLQAFAEADSGWRLDLIGDGLMRERYERQARDLNLMDRVSFKGHGGSALVREAMARAAVFVAPSRAENYPLVLLEAMAAGLPVLSTRVGGVSEMIVDNESGLLVEAGDPAALREGLERLAAEPELRSRLAVGGARVAERHDWVQVTKAVEGELVLAARGASGVAGLNLGLRPNTPNG